MDRTITDAGPLTEAERALIVELLDRERRELPVEIHHTENRAYRDGLEQRLKLVENLLLRMVV